MKVLVVGLNPSRKLGNSPSLKNLHDWLEYLDLKVVSFQNLYEDFDKSKLKICLIKKLSKEYDKIIALGNKVSNQLIKEGVDHFMLPHPSPLNRLLNNKVMIRHSLVACKSYLEG